MTKQELKKCSECKRDFKAEQLTSRDDKRCGYTLTLYYCPKCWKMIKDEKSQLLETLAHEKAHSELNKIEGYEGIKEEIIEKQKPIILMDEYERKKESERKPCPTPCPVHCKNRK